MLFTTHNNSHEPPSSPHLPGGVLHTVDFGEKVVPRKEESREIGYRSCSGGVPCRCGPATRPQQASRRGTLMRWYLSTSHFSDATKTVELNLKHSIYCLPQSLRKCWQFRAEKWTDVSILRIETMEYGEGSKEELNFSRLRKRVLEKGRESGWHYLWNIYLSTFLSSIFS